MRTVTISPTFTEVTVSDTVNTDKILVYDFDTLLLATEITQRPAADGCLTSDRFIRFNWHLGSPIPLSVNVGIEINGVMHDLKMNSSQQFFLEPRPAIKKLWLRALTLNGQPTFEVRVPTNTNFEVFLSGVKLGTISLPGANNICMAQFFAQNYEKLNAVTQQTANEITILLNGEYFTIVPSWPTPPNHSSERGVEYAVKKNPTFAPAQPTKPMTISFAAGPVPRCHSVTIEGFESNQSVQVVMGTDLCRLGGSTMPVDGKILMTFAGESSLALMDAAAAANTDIPVTINGKHYRLRNKIETKWPIKFELVPVPTIAEEAAKYISSVGAGTELHNFLNRLKSIKDAVA